MAYDSKTTTRQCGCTTVVHEHDFFNNEYSTTKYCAKHKQENVEAIKNAKKKWSTTTPVKLYRRNKATGKLLLSDILKDEFCIKLEHKLDTRKISENLMKLCRFVKYKKQWYANDMIKVIYKKYIK
uniref:Uncharacterized protein n=1 Tax=Nesodiprion zhejiangensis nucleopolyhedrovirus TaxID=3135970 RepID=A0AAN0LJB3_9BACU